MLRIYGYNIQARIYADPNFKIIQTNIHIYIYIVYINIGVVTIKKNLIANYPLHDKCLEKITSVRE